MLAAFTMSNTRLLLLSGIGAPYDPVHNRGVVGKNFCYQTGAGVSVFFKDRWINPFMASGSTGTVIDEFNNDNFDHTGLGFLGGADIAPGVLQRPPDRPSHAAARHAALGHALEAGQRRMVFARLRDRRRGELLPAIARTTWTWIPTTSDAYGQPLLRMTFDWRDNELKMCAFVTDKMRRDCQGERRGFIGTPGGLSGPSICVTTRPRT